VQVQEASPGAAPRYTLAFPVQPSLTMVQKPLQQPLLQAIQRYLHGLGATTTVQPGEQYRYNSQTTTYSARQPLQASLNFVLDTDVHAAADCTIPYLGPACTYAETGADCRSICSIDWIDSRTIDQSAGWTVGIVTRPNWTYRTAGQSRDPKAGLSEYQGDQQFTTLRITWENQAWHVSAHSEGESGFDDPNCVYAIGAINSSSEIANVDNGGSLKSTDGTMHITGWSFISGENRALGCLVKAQMQSSSVGGKKPVTSDVYFLYRFGVLSAVDKTARTLNPEWPLSKADVKLILPEILTRPAFTT
jgi:hypothetical protein